MAAKILELIDRSAAPETVDMMRFIADYPRRVYGKDFSCFARAWAALNAEERRAALAAVRPYVDYLKRTATERRFVPLPATWLNAKRFHEDYGALDRPLQDLGQCWWNRNGTRDPQAGQCTEPAVVQDMSNGNCYCGRHGRSLGLRVRAA